MKHIHKQAGFTVLELMIASSIFAVVLLVVAAGILRFSSDYYKGINSTNVQTVTRGVMSDVVANIQFGRSDPTALPSATVPPGQPQGYCIDNTFYTYVIGQEVDASHSGLVKTDGSSCGSATPTVPVPNALSANQQDMLGAHMRVAQFSITHNTGDVWNVSITIVYADDGLLVDGSGNALTGSSTAANWATARCRNQAGQEFCAVSQLTTSVQKRL